MTNIPEEPLLFDLFYGKKGKATADSIPPVSEETPIFRDIHIKDIICRGAGRAMYFNGLPEMKIKNIYIDNVSIINAQSGIVINQADNVAITNTTVEPAQGNVITLTGASNIEIKELHTKPQTAQAAIGSGCSDIKIVSSDIKRENTTIDDTTNPKTIKFK